MSSASKTSHRLEAFIVPTDGQSVLANWRGPSAAGWEARMIHEKDQGERGVYCSNSAKSDENEALVGALVEIIRCPLITGGLELYCKQKWLCLSINEYLPGWKNGGWRKPEKYRELWMEFVRIRDQKGIEVHATHIPKGDHQFKEEFELLREMARIILQKHAKALGTPNGGFDEYSGEANK
jgi:hypothetical protein